MLYTAQYLVDVQQYIDSEDGSDGVHSVAAIADIQPVISGCAGETKAIRDKQLGSVGSPLIQTKLTQPWGSGFKRFRHVFVATDQGSNEEHTPEMPKCQIVKLLCELLKCNGLVSLGQQQMNNDKNC